MLEALSITLKNVVYFKDAHLDITKHPFTVISGHNVDSRISSTTSNGAGKSLLWSSFPNLRYDSTPLGVGKKRKDMLDKDSSIVIPIKANDGRVYTITQTPGSFKILRDGKDLEVRTVPLQKKKLEEIFPITEDEFYSYVYLQSQRPLAFQIDKPAARLQYLTSMFNLDVYDQLKKYFTKKLGEIKNKQVEFDVLNAQLVKVNGLLERLDWSDEAAEELKAAQNVIRTLGNDSKQLQSKIERYKAALAVCQQYGKLKKQQKKLKPALSRKDAEKQLELHERQVAYREELKAYEAQVEQLTSQLAEIGEVKSLKSLIRQIEKLEEHQDSEQTPLENMYESRQNYRTLVKRLEECEKELKDVGLSPNDVKKLVKRGVSEHKATLSSASAVMQLESIVDDCDDGSCPTCKQQVNIKQFKKAIAEAKREHAKALEGIERFNTAEAYAKLLTKVKTHEFNEAREQDFQERKRMFKERAEKIERLERSKAAAESAARLTKRLENLEKPRKPKDKVEYEVKELREILEQHSELRRINSLIESLEEQHGTLDEDKLQASLDKVSKKYSKIERKYASAQDVCSKLGSKSSEHRVLVREQKDALAQLELLKPIINQRDMYKTLERAYSSKGLKVVAANQILHQIEQYLNQYSNLIFAEPFKFTLEATGDGVHCIVDRGNGKRSDIRMLSGAESDCFRLLWMWVMLIMADDTRRTNFVVLDEPDAHMDETTKSLFIERFLPALRTVVPHIFLITPKDKHAYSECAYLTVVKHKGVSKLVESFDESSGIREAYAGADSGDVKPKKRTKKKRDADYSA